MTVSHVLAQTLFGGVTPLVAGWIVTRTGDPASPGLYLSAVTLPSLGLPVGARRMLAVGRRAG